MGTEATAVLVLGAVAKTRQIASYARRLRFGLVLGSIRLKLTRVSAFLSGLPRYLPH